MKNLKTMIRTNCILKNTIFRIYLYIYKLIAIKQHKKNLEQYNNQYFGVYDEEYIMKIYARHTGMNFYFLLEQSHRNIGDLAIGVADQELYEKFFPNAKKHFVYEPVYKQYRKVFKEIIDVKDVIVLTGGGSIGNYQEHELMREDIMKRFRCNCIISMPQSMMFGSDKKGKKAKKKAQKIYNSCEKMILCAREQFTFADMKKSFSGPRIELLPDLVMTLDFSKEFNFSKRLGIILCFRNDIETVLSEEDVLGIEKKCLTFSNKVMHTDMMYENEFVSLENRKHVVMSKISEFSKAKVVVTDRLHCMIFCAISGTPCISFSNYNTKIVGSFEWINHLDYIFFCEEKSNFEDYLRKAMNLDSTSYDNLFAYEQYSRIMGDILKLSVGGNYVSENYMEN